MTWDQFGRNIKAARNQKGLLQSEVAEALGVSVQTVYNWEKARMQPRMEMFGKLAELLDKPPAWFFGPEMADSNGNGSPSPEVSPAQWLKVGAVIGNLEDDDPDLADLLRRLTLRFGESDLGNLWQALAPAA